jgi:hypothetical protein
VLCCVCVCEWKLLLGTEERRRAHVCGGGEDQVRSTSTGENV